MVIKCILKNCLLQVLEMKIMVIKIFKSAHEINSKLDIISKN